MASRVRKQGDPVGMPLPRLSAKHEWGVWKISKDLQTLVCTNPYSAGYQVSLAELTTTQAANARILDVIAVKDSWVDQRVIEDLRRAIVQMTKLSLPLIDLR